MTRAKQRWTLLVVLSLLGGALLSVVVAWVALLHADFSGGRTVDTRGGWPVPVPASWPSPYQIDTVRAPGCERQMWAAIPNEPGDHMDLARVSICGSGWPLLCMRAVVWDRQIIDFSPGASPLPKPGADTPPRTWWTSGAPIPTALLRFDPSGTKRMPLRPIAFAFAADTALYASVLALPVVAFRIWRKTYRRRRGQCVGCGYNLSGLPPGAGCPECGKGAA